MAFNVYSEHVNFRINKRDIKPQFSTREEFTCICLNANYGAENA
jgi:hypothetical protein